ncbi:MAG: ribonuclease J [Pseudomonadota bacterium]
MTKDTLCFLPLGGSGEIGMNMNLYGFGRGESREWIMIDCGVTFGDLSTPGIDLVCPDPAYILERKDKLKALLLTHGHEDHIGAVALLAPELGCPVYATPFTASLVRRKLEERGDAIDLRIIEMGARFDVGPFDLQYVTLTHSIPEPSAIVIRTKLGTVFHTGDWKLDRAPTLGPNTDDASIRALGDDGVLAIVCDSTNVLSPGESGSESRVRDHLSKIIAAETGRVAVTTFASNVARVVSICEAARENDRSVCLVGRSMLRIVDVAREVGLIDQTVTFVDPKEAGYLPRENTLYLCTGSQGESRAALSRIARDDHADLTLNEGDTVIFSSKIIPGNEREIFDLQNNLVELGVKVITEKDAFIHVSGHPCRDELREMYSWARPRIAIPVHGEARHLEEHAAFALELGAEDALAPRNGDLIRIAPNGPEVIDEVPSGRLYLDGDLLMPDGAAPMRERRKLGYAGSVTVSVVLDDRGRMASPPAVAIVGGPLSIEGEEDDVQTALSEAIEEAIADTPRAKRENDDAVEVVVRRTVRGRMNALWGKRPPVAVLIHRC